MSVIIFLSVKYILSYVRFLEPSTLGKLIFHDIFQSIKQKHGHAYILGPHTLCKLICFNYFPKYQTETWSCLILQTTYLG